MISSGTTKIRISKNSSADTDFIEKRRVALEWYCSICYYYTVISFLHRIANHSILRLDAYFREFLEQENELPKPSSGQVLSSATAIRLIKNVGEAVGKWTFKMDEVDEYFYVKNQELENWDIQ